MPSTHTKKCFLVTIDGPAGAGKTTVSRILADHLDYKYIDTGALYRGVAFEARAAGLEQNDEVGLEHLCNNLKLKFVRSHKETRLLSNDVDITDQIRTPKITMLASAFSARPVVRNFLLGLQRDMGKEKGVVFEGRDMGTVVFPHADIKFFLDANPKIRALRRFQEISPKTSQTIEEVEREIRSRDKNDSTRELAPLRPANDAILIDSTNLSAQEVVEGMLSYIDKMR